MYFNCFLQGFDFMNFEINFNFLIKLFLHDKRVKTTFKYLMNEKELLEQNKKHFSSFLKGFHLSKIDSELRVRL